MKNVVILYNMATFTKQHIGIALFAIAIIVVSVFKPKLLEFNARDSLSNGEGLERGEMLVNGAFALNYDLDGKLDIVELTKKGELKTKTWLSKKAYPTSQLSFIDGLLAISTENSDSEEKIRWDKGSNAPGASVLKLNEKGVLSIRNAQGKPIWVSSGKMKDGFTPFVSSDTQSVLDTKTTQLQTDTQELQAKITELDHLGNPSLNVSKMQMDTTVYLSILWTALATALVYYIVTNI
jgi:hypothetical protein